MSHPKVSIVLPTYNRADTLEDSIKSLLSQTFQDFEIIISDDGSTDQTGSLVSSFSDKRIRYIRSETQEGANHARNLGIKASLGEFIAFQDSDDYWYPDKLRYQMDAIQKAGEEGKICFCGMMRYIDNKPVYIPKKKRKIKAGILDLHDELLKGNFVSTQTLVVNKEILYDVGLFDESIKKLQDWDLILRLAREHKIVFVDEPLVNAFINKDGITMSVPIWEAIEEMLYKHSCYFTQNPRALLIQYVNICNSSVKERKFTVTIRYCLHSMVMLLNIMFQNIKKH